MVAKLEGMMECRGQMVEGSTLGDEGGWEVAPELLDGGQGKTIVSNSVVGLVTQPGEVGDNDSQDRGGKEDKKVAGQDATMEFGEWVVPAGVPPPPNNRGGLNLQPYSLQDSW